MKQGISIAHNVRAYIVPALTALLFVILIGISIFAMRYRTEQRAGDMMIEDVGILARVFEQINSDCTILSFDYQKNKINFLNVGSFAGSEVGPMNLAHPGNWRGPYLKDNPTVQDKEYEVVHTEKGYFITPGTGVRLPNGKVVGIDITLDEHADIAKMMRDEQELNYKGKALAAPILVPGQQVTLRHFADAPFIDF